MSSTRGVAFPSMVPLRPEWLIAALLVVWGGGRDVRVASMATAVVGALAARRLRSRWGDVARHPLFPFAAMFLLFATLAFLLSPDPAQGWPSFQKILGATAFGILAAGWDRREKARFGIGIVLIGAVHAALFLGGGLGFRSFLLFPGNPVYGAYWIMSAGLLSLGMAMDSSLEKRRRWAWAAVGLVLSAAGVSSGVRSVLPGVLVGGSVLLYRWRGRRALWAGALAAGLAMAATPPRIWSRWAKTEDPRSASRILLWAGAVDGILEKPLLGWGPGRFESLHRSHARPLERADVRFGRTTAFAHNDWFQVGATLGVPAAAVLALLGVAFFVLRPAGAAGAGISAVAAATATMGLFNFPFYAPANGWMIAALLSGVRFERARPWSVGADDRRAGAGAAIVFVLWAAASAGTAVAGLGTPRWPLHPGHYEAGLGEADALMHGAEGRAPADIERAEKLLAALSARFPERPEAWRAWGHLEADHRAEPRAEVILTRYDRALRLWPGQAVWWKELADALERGGEIPLARSTARAALAREPAYGDAALLLARLLRRSGDAAGADRWLSGWWARWGDRAPSVDSPFPYRDAVWRRSADAFAKEGAAIDLSLGRPADALRRVQRISDGDPDRVVLEAVARHGLGQKGRAVRALRDLLARDPGRADAAAWLARWSGNGGRR